MGLTSKGDGRESPGIVFEKNSRTRKVVEDEFGPGKSWDFV